LTLNNFAGFLIFSRRKNWKNSWFRTLTSGMNFLMKNKENISVILSVSNGLKHGKYTWKINMGFSLTLSRKIPQH
jgi:hypothetical protein